MRVAVVGAGKMGLPLACQLARRGALVTACDINPSIVDAINRGECPIDEPGMPPLVGALVADGRLRATTDTAAAAGAADVIVVIVPALLTEDRDVDASALESASRHIAATLRPGALVAYETTLPVGGTRSRLVPVLETSGFRAGMDFDVVFSPERVKSGTVLDQLEKNPKVVGGITPASAARGARFYEQYLGAPVVDVGSLEAAEMVKVAGMVYRDVNIALANELARYAAGAGVDLPSLIDVVNTDGEAALLQPGVGVGGHCTPVYPWFLIRDAERRHLPATLAARARRINDDQPSHVVDALERTSGPVRGRRVLVLGLAFRPQVREHVLSPAFALRDELVARGAEVLVDDPLYSADEIRAHGFEAVSLESATLPPLLILNTAHDRFRQIDFNELRRRGVEVVVDGRNLWDPASVHRAGLTYVGIGRPGPPAVLHDAPMPIARPRLEAEEAEAAADVVRSGWVLQGPEVAAFEREFAEQVGAPFACAVSSGTAALHLALDAVGVGPGDEVVTVSHSHIASVNAVRFCGATPVLVDIEPATFNIDPSRIEPVITARTRAILCVHQMGMPSDLAAILPIARRYGLRVVEDAACAIGSEIFIAGAWQRIGRPHGDAACFSFHPRKVITTGDGGMITTASPEIERLVRLKRQHGMDLEAHARDASRALAVERYRLLGYNYRMTDLQAAVGRAQLRKLERIVAERRQLAATYRRRLTNLPGLALPAEPGWARSNWQTFCVRLPDEVVAMDVRRALLQRNISTRGGIMNAHEEPAGRDIPLAMPLAVSERARATAVALPLYPGMTPSDIERVAEALAEALAGAGLKLP
ncbi:MAG: nucleotide sugar dehydrogenase [Acidobacteria bacterium]|nr:nucleotide sugar dehydrogenase [Acidobacteriota bacterium]